MSTREQDSQRMMSTLQRAQWRKLRQNAHKGSWSLTTLHTLCERLHEEVAELQDAVQNLERASIGGMSLTGLDELADAAVDEAGDVANFAGFIADRISEEMRISKQQRRSLLQLDIERGEV